MQTHYQPPQADLWQGRIDAKPNEYFYQLIQLLDLNQIHPAKSTGYALLGFACDEGVKRNLGRPGAKQGPEQIKKTLARFALHQSIHCYDAGQIVCADDNLEAAQQALGEAVSQILQLGLTPIVLGGGHETAWGHYQGLAQHKRAKNLGIVNFDAHFDLRDPLPGNLGSSGTPFRQIATERLSAGLAFDYYCLGIQPQANTESLFNTAKALNVRYIDARTFNNEPAQADELIKHIITEHDALYVSICLDAFAASLAPGVSAPQVLGVNYEPVLRCLESLIQSGKLLSLDIVELAPCYDANHQTSQLAASLIRACL